MVVTSSTFPVMPSHDYGELVARIRTDEVLGTLKSVQVAPLETISSDGGGFDSRTLSDLRSGGPRLTAGLGEFAANVVSRELSIAILLKAMQKGRRRLRIGVAGGSTLLACVSRIDLRARIAEPLLDVEIFPLVVGPVPNSEYSASLVALELEKAFVAAGWVSASHKTPDEYGELVAHPPHERVLSRSPEVGIFVRRIAIARAEYSHYSNETFESEERAFHTEMMDEFRPKGDNGLWVTDDDTALDWVLTGVGGRACRQCQLHLELVKRYFSDVDAVVGDICSRFFGSNGAEIGETVQDDFVSIKFEALRAISRYVRAHGGRRVVAIAGGETKVDPLVTLLRSGNRPFNCLITDEFTVRRLFRELPKETASRSRRGTGRERKGVRK